MVVFNYKVLINKRKNEAIMTKGANDQIYIKLVRLTDGIETISELLILKSGSYMDLHIERFREDAISMTHYYKQNGALVPDPDMEIRVFPKFKKAEALTCQDSFGFRQAYPSEGDGELTYADI